MSLSCTVSEILSVISQNLKRSRCPEYTPFGLSVYRACASTHHDQLAYHVRSAHLS